jgi:hypothetical protein
MATNAHSTQIEALVQSLEPVDWVQPMLTANLPPGQRILAGLRGTLRRRFTELSPSELNMKVLACLTPARMPPQ